MAVPKRKVSSARRDKRRANWKLEAPNLTSCPKCQEYKLPHVACKSCGYYNGRQAIKTEA